MSKKTYGLALALEEDNALAIFSGGSVDSLISDIEGEVNSIVLDVSTAKGRKDIASLAHKVSRSKTALDALGKGLVGEWKAKSKAVDAERKQVRDRLDALRDEVRRPLTDWEDAEKAREAAIAIEKEISEAYELAVSENDLFDRAREIERKEEKARLDEENRLAEIARIAREDKIKADAIEADRRDREEQAERERKAAEDKVIAARLAEENAIREKQEADARRVRELEEQEARIRKEHDDMEREQARLEEAEKAAAEKKAANKRHQASVNNRILKELIAIGISEEHAKALIIKVAKGQMSDLKVIY